MSKASRRLLIILSTLMFVASVTMLVLLLINREHTHKWATAWTTDVEYHWHVCENGCKEQSDKAKHTYGDWTTTKDPTETEQGARERTCTVCGYKETGTIDELNHTHVWSTAIDYTYAYDETSGVYTFTATRTCEKNTEHKQTVTSISSSNPRVDKAATCVAKGLTTYTVSFDDNWSGTTDKFTETHDVQVETPIDTVNGHKIATAWSHDNDKHWHVCENDGCDEHFNEESHQWGSWHETKEPSATEDGESQRECGTCGKTEKKTVAYDPTHEHDWQDIEYTWNEDHTVVTATQECKNDTEHTHTRTVTSTGVEEGTVTPANCTYAETHNCTVTFPANSFIGNEPKTVSYTVGDILENGHVYTNPIPFLEGGVDDNDKGIIHDFAVIGICSVCNKEYIGTANIKYQEGENPQGKDAWTYEIDTTSRPATCMHDGVTCYRLRFYTFNGVDISWMNGKEGYYLFGITEQQAKTMIETTADIYNQGKLPKNDAAHYDTNKWEFDENVHWNPRYADCAHTDQPEKSNSVPHTFVNGVCSTCGYHEGAHYDTNKWEFDVDGHWNPLVTDCTHGQSEKGNYADHTFVNGVCSTCGYYEGMTFTLSDDGSYYTLSGYTGTATYVVIPERFNGKPVTAIGDNAFKDNVTITSIVIHEGITVINAGAFDGCTKLANIFYKGTTSEQWDLITGDGKAAVKKVLYYAEGLITRGDWQYWHYVCGVAMEMRY